MKSIDKLYEEQIKLSENLKEVKKQIDECLSKTLVRCEGSFGTKGCKKGFEIRELEYIQTHFYTPPRGCMEGDYWNFGEGQWKCPECGEINRLYNKPDIEKLKFLFKKVINIYDNK